MRGRDQLQTRHQNTEVFPTRTESDVIITAFITILYQLETCRVNSRAESQSDDAVTCLISNTG